MMLAIPRAQRLCNLFLGIFTVCVPGCVNLTLRDDQCGVSRKKTRGKASRIPALRNSYHILAVGSGWQVAWTV